MWDGQSSACVFHFGVWFSPDAELQVRLLMGVDKICRQLPVRFLVDFQEAAAEGEC